MYHLNQLSISHPKLDSICASQQSTLIQSILMLYFPNPECSFLSFQFLVHLILSSFHFIRDLTKRIDIKKNNNVIFVINIFEKFDLFKNLRTIYHLSSPIQFLPHEPTKHIQTKGYLLATFVTSTTFSVQRSQIMHLFRI